MCRCSRHGRRSRGRCPGRHPGLAATCLGLRAHGAPPAGVACAAEYETRLREFLALSSAATTFTPREHMPDWYWEAALELRNWHRQTDRAFLSVESVGHNDSWLEHLFGVAQTELLGCWVAGGRYWEAELQLEDYSASLPPNASHLPGCWRAHLHARVGIDGLPPLLRSALCAPARCERTEVTALLLPRFFGLLLGSREALPFVLPEQTVALELSDWSALSLDFVIAGIDGCGSTSLHRNLAQHPEIGFTSDDVDAFFGQIIQHRLLPLRSQVEAFNGRRAGSRRRPAVLGLCNPTLFSNAIARQALALIPDVRLVIVLCDPLGRNEKRFMVHHMCHEDMDAAVRSGDASPVRAWGAACRRSIAALLDEPALLSKGLVGSHLAEVADIFGARLMLLHQESLREKPRETYSAIAAFVGTSVPFASKASFHRYNSRRGHRTDLCRNASLARVLQQRLRADYEMLERLMGDGAPPSLRSRQTRCNRPEELSEGAPHCGNRSARCTY